MWIARTAVIWAALSRAKQVGLPGFPRRRRISLVGLLPDGDGLHRRPRLEPVLAENALTYDRQLLLLGSKRNEVLDLWEVHRYGTDSYGDADYVSIYGMPPAEWKSSM